PEPQGQWCGDRRRERRREGPGVRWARRGRDPRRRRCHRRLAREKAGRVDHPGPGGARRNGHPAHAEYRLARSGSAPSGGGAAVPRLPRLRGGGGDPGRERRRPVPPPSWSRRAGAPSAARAHSSDGRRLRRGLPEAARDGRSGEGHVRPVTSGRRSFLAALAAAPMAGLLGLASAPLLYLLSRFETLATPFDSASLGHTVGFALGGAAIASLVGGTTGALVAV